MNNLEGFIYRIDGIGESSQIERSYIVIPRLIKHSDLRPSDPIPYPYRSYLISLISDHYLIDITGEFFPRLVIGGSQYFMIID